MMVVRLQQQSIICISNDVSRVTGNADLDYAGGGSGPACARQNSGTDWDNVTIFASLQPTLMTISSWTALSRLMPAISSRKAIITMF